MDGLDEAVSDKTPRERHYTTALNTLLCPKEVISTVSLLVVDRTIPDHERLPRIAKYITTDDTEARLHFLEMISCTDAKPQNVHQALEDVIESCLKLHEPVFNKDWKDQPPFRSESIWNKTFEILYNDFKQWHEDVHLSRHQGLNLKKGYFSYFDSMILDKLATDNDEGFRAIVETATRFADVPENRGVRIGRNKVPDEVLGFARGIILENVDQILRQSVREGKISPELETLYNNPESKISLLRKAAKRMHDFHPEIEPAEPEEHPDSIECEDDQVSRPTRLAQLHDAALYRVIQRLFPDSTHGQSASMA